MIFRSPFPDVTIPEVPLTPFILQHAERLAAKPALIDGITGRTLTDGQMVEAVRKIAASLAQRGFHHGDVLALYSPNLPEYPIPFLAAALLGGITTTINPLYTVDELTFQLNDARARYVFTVPAFTVGYLAPPIMLALAKQPMVDQYDLSHLRVLVSAAAPLGREVQEACESRLHCLIVQAWGMTETSPGATLNPLDPARARIGSVGVCMPNTECKVVGITSGAELGPGQEGEMCVRGPQAMKGYLNNPAATAAMRDADGWLHTGDIGYADADGYFYVVDRLKELIKYKGFQVAPAELEDMLLTHSAIADAAVIPSSDGEAGEVPKAYVVLKVGAAASAEEIMAYVAGRVAPQKKIRRLEFIEQIPKSASGKILRRVLIEQDRAR